MCIRDSYNENHRQEGTVFPMKKILKWTVLLVLAAAVFLVLGVVADGWKLYLSLIHI